MTLLSYHLKKTTTEGFSSSHKVSISLHILTSQVWVMDGSGHRDCISVYSYIEKTILWPIKSILNRIVKEIIHIQVDEQL